MTAIDRTAAGAQYVLPGAEKAKDAALAQRACDAPLRPKLPQEPAGTLGGLFEYEGPQLDLLR